MRIIKSILLISLTFLVTLTLMEVIIQSSEIDSLSVTKNDLTLGSSLKPNRNLISFKEGFYMGGTNKYGYYGHSYPHKKPNNTIRIALVGDSYVESHQLFDRISMRALIENKLSESLNKKVEVLNFGMSGFNLNDDYCLYSLFVKNFNPDFSLFFVSNEDFDAQPTSNRRPQCAINGDSLIINHKFRLNKDFIHRMNTSWYRGQSIILGWVFRVKEIIHKNLWGSVIFDKFWNFQNKDVSNKQEEQNQKIKIEPVTAKIVDYLKHDKKIIFVEKEPLSKNVESLIVNKRARLIRLDKVNNKKFHYWDVSKTYGHWNYEAHQLVADQISNHLLNEINYTEK